MVVTVAAMPAVSRTVSCQEIAQGNVGSAVGTAGTRTGLGVTVTAAIVASAAGEAPGLGLGVGFVGVSSSLHAGRRATARARAEARTLFRKATSVSGRLRCAPLRRLFVPHPRQAFREHYHTGKTCPWNELP